MVYNGAINFVGVFGSEIFDDIIKLRVTRSSFRSGAEFQTGLCILLPMYKWDNNYCVVYL